MNAEFWHERWAARQIGFHEPAVNPLLEAHLGALRLIGGARVFLPLCGMTLDIDWLLARGHRVAGIELSATAVDELFARLGVTPVVTRVGSLERRSAPGLDVFVGDLFALDAAMLGPVDAVYDRAALIALPADMRQRYAPHLATVTRLAPQLLITVEYDQAAMAGPPFSVDDAEVHRLLAGRAAALLADAPVSGGLKGRLPASEKVWRVSGGGA